MLYAEVKHDIFGNNIFIQIDQEDVNTICYDFDLFVDDLVELLDGEKVNRLKDVVMFKLPGIEYIYAICKDEYMRLIFTFQVQLGGFTPEDYKTIQKLIAQLGELSCEYIC